MKVRWSTYGNSYYSGEGESLSDILCRFGECDRTTARLLEKLVEKGHLTANEALDIAGALNVNVEPI